MRKIVVYDFDGTLSYGDSLETLFNQEMHGWKALYKAYYYFLKVLSKLKLSTVKQEKEHMIKLLFHSDEKVFRKACDKQAEEYKLTPIMALLKKDVAEGNRVIVLSASSEYFLKKIFQGMNVEILGTTFNIKDGKILGINQHPFFHEKVDTLVNNGISRVDNAYFDSKWDECLKPLCKNWYKIKNGEIVEKGSINNI